MMEKLRGWEEAQEAFEIGLQGAYEAARDHEYLSIDGNKWAERFGAFVDQWAVGTVLDVGCGPQYLPIYLKNIPEFRIVGIDPIRAPHPFRFVQGMIEDYDGEADTVICATSLDHFDDVKEAACAMRRIAQQRIVLWHCGNRPTPENEHSWHVTDEDVERLFRAPRVRDGDFYVFQR